jgi:hypothetical protein
LHSDNLESDLDQIEVKITEESKLEYFPDFIKMILPPDYKVDWDYLEIVVRDEIYKVKDDGQTLKMSEQNMALLKTHTSIGGEE